MSDAPKDADPFSGFIAQWTKNWQQMADASNQAGEAWSKSVMPFLVERASERKTGPGLGDELSEAIERLAQGPRLADVWDIDRKLMLAFSAWLKMRQKLMAYNANASRPWARALQRYNKMALEDKELTQKGWREAFAVWSGIANQELIANQRTDEFMAAQRELLQASLDFRNCQTEINETFAKLFGMPTQRDFDDLTRQLTELRREVRALARRAVAPDGASPGRRAAAKSKKGAAA